MLPSFPANTVLVTDIFNIYAGLEWVDSTINIEHLCPYLRKGLLFNCFGLAKPDEALR